MEKAVKDNQEFHGENNIDTVHFYEMQGDCLVMLEQYEQAKALYSKALGCRETYFPADENALNRLNQKYTCAQKNENSGMPLLEIWP